MIKIDINKNVTLTPEPNKKLSLAVIDKATKEMIHIEEEFNKPIDLNFSYYLDMLFVVADSETKELSNFDMPEFKTVVIEGHTKALGDQIAFISMVDLFQKKHKCKVIYRCYFDDLFRPFYPNLDIRHQYFVGDSVTKPETVKAEAVYIIGYAVNGFTNDEGIKISPVDCRKIPLQQSAALQLGLDTREVQPDFRSKLKKRLIKGKYVVICTMGTAKFKVWNNKKGFPAIVKHFKAKGYKVIDIGGTTDSLEGTISMNGKLAWKDLINILQHSELFMSGSNGLAWMAWACHTKVVTISSMSTKWTEFDHYKISNNDVCNSCWNDTSLVFDNKDYNYCPRNNDYICSSSITPEMVIDELNMII